MKTLDRRALLLSAAALGLVSGAAGRAEGKKPEYFADRAGYALRGYDPVAYFTIAAPTRGRDAHVSRFNGAQFRFARAENKALFDTNPAAYAPQFGGYCAWAVSRGYTASNDPAAWHIHDGKLYLNYNKQVRASWRRDVPGNIAKGERNWPRVLIE